MTNITLEKNPLESETQVEKSINIIMDLDNPQEVRVKASEKLREELPTIYTENPELFSESCESILGIFPSLDTENEEVKENIFDAIVASEDAEVNENLFYALGDSMAPGVKQDYPRIWEASLQLFQSAYEQGYLRKKANHYRGCMLFGQDPIELENSRARTKKLKSTMKRIKRLEKNDPSDKKILSEKLNKYINPELLDESEEIFDLAFVALCKRLGYEYRQLKEIYKSKKPVDNEQSTQVADGVLILLDVLDNCMNEELKEKRPDLFKKGMQRLRSTCSYQMSMFSKGLDSGVVIPEEFLTIVHTSTDIALRLTLSSEEAKKAF